MSFLSGLFDADSSILSNGWTDLVGGTQTPSTSTTGYNVLPPWAQAGYQNLYNGAAGQNPSIYGPSNITGLQNTALAGLASLPNVPGYNFGGQANNAFGQSSAALGKVGNQVNLSNGYLTNATQNINSGTNPISNEELSGAINGFMNPYNDQVVNSALVDLNRQTQNLQTGINSQAANAGAYGSTRQALDESELGRTSQLEAGQLSGQLRQQGFSQASQQALNQLQQERANYLTGAGLNIGQSGQALQGGNEYLQQGSALSQLGNSLMGARSTANSINTSNALNQLQGGTQLQQYNTQVQQAPLQQYQNLLAILQPLLGGNTQQGPRNINGIGGLMGGTGASANPGAGAGAAGAAM